MSDNLQRYLDHLHGTVDDEIAERVPEVVILSAPEDALEAVAMHLLNRYAPEVEGFQEAIEAGVHLGWGYNTDNDPVYNGRLCCAELMNRLALVGPGRLEIPSQHTCEGCQTVYRIQWPSMELH